MADVFTKIWKRYIDLNLIEKHYYVIFFLLLLFFLVIHYISRDLSTLKIKINKKEKKEPSLYT